LTIEGWHPARLNELLGNWQRRARLKKHDRELVAGYALVQRIPSATGKRRVSLLLTLAPGQRGADPDSFWKSTLDALVHAGLLLDDNRQAVELGDVRFTRGPARETTVIIEDLT
jgi:hypothetical protein